MLRFQQIDREFVLLGEMAPEMQKREAQNKVVAFVQEGIGALLAYLPSETAMNTLKDFLAIIEPQAKEERLLPSEKLVSPIEAVVKAVPSRQGTPPKPKQEETKSALPVPIP